MNLSCAISCSFRFLDQIAELKVGLEKVGVEVLAPLSTAIKGQKDGFAILESDHDEIPPGELQATFLVTMTEADFHYVLLPDRRCGASVAAEAAYAWYYCVPTIWSCLPRNATYAPEVDKELVKAFTDPRWLPDGVLSPSELLERIGTGEINRKRFKKVHSRRLTYFRFFGFAWRPKEIVSERGRVFRPKNLER